MESSALFHSLNSTFLYLFPPRAVALASVKREYTSKKKNTSHPRTTYAMGAGHAGRTVNDIPTTGCMALVFAAASPEQKATPAGEEWMWVWVPVVVFLLCSAPEFNAPD
uniref:Uncharacterized protein n=1 Tax=Anopheles coluzzii TaxID=1518534 RepID=A0A8W7P407_ANOCL